MRVVVTAEPQELSEDLGAGRFLLQNVSSSHIYVARTESGLGDEEIIPAGSQGTFRLAGEQYLTSNIWVVLADPEGDDAEVTIFQEE